MIPISRKRVRLALAIMAGLAATTPAYTQTLAGDIPVIRRDPRMSGPVPVPTAERDLPTAIAERWFHVSDDAQTLEGAAFDLDGDLLFCDVTDSRIMRLTMEKRLSVALAQSGLHAGGLAVRPDGAVLVAGGGDGQRGTLGVLQADAKNFRAALPPERGFVPNDIALDKQGGFYFTDFKGSLSKPEGGVYHVAPDMRTVTPIVQHLARPNGVAISPDGKYLWVTEFGQNRLLQIEMDGPTKVADLGIKVAYQFVGPAPDSMRVDAEGNAYVALIEQGRVLILSPGGIPIGQILLPDRERGHNLMSTSLALRPGSDEVYIVSSDGSKGQGANIFRARTFVTAPAVRRPAGRQ